MRPASPPIVQDRIERYDTLKRSFLRTGCPDCPLKATRKNLVFDRGNPQADILVIGEAPGEQEEKTGQCFVGRAGKMLDRMLTYAGLDPARDVLIANVLKCRPPDNRTPTQEEAHSCLPTLLEQIRITQPKLMLLMGRTAYGRLYPDKAKTLKMSEEAGQVADATIAEHRTRIAVMYHPAYLLYDPRKRTEAMTHLDNVRQELKRQHLDPKPKPEQL